MVFDWGSTKTHLFSEFRNRKAGGRDVKPRNMNFQRLRRRGGGINREGVFIRMNTVAEGS